MDRDEEIMLNDFLERHVFDTHEPDGVWFEAEDIAVTQLQRMAEFKERSREDESFWMDYIRSAHLALTAVMVAALEGSAGVGAMTPKAAEKTLRWLDADDRHELEQPTEQTMFFTDLIAAIQQQGRLEYSEAITLSDDQALHAKELNWMRGIIEHPKHTRWLVPIESISGATCLVCDLFEKIMNSAPHRFGKEAKERVAHALLSMS